MVIHLTTATSLPTPEGWTTPLTVLAPGVEPGPARLVMQEVRRRATVSTRTHRQTNPKTLPERLRLSSVPRFNSYRYLFYLNLITLPLLLNFHLILTFSIILILYRWQNFYKLISLSAHTFCNLDPIPTSRLKKRLAILLPKTAYLYFLLAFSLIILKPLLSFLFSRNLIWVKTTYLIRAYIAPLLYI